MQLTALVAESPTGRHTLALLPGAQHGFTLHGYRLALPPQLPHMVGPGLTTDPFTSETATRIRERIAHPVRAGALATVSITGLGYGTLVSIPLTALSDRADVLVLESPRRAELGAYAVPVPARPLLGAARTFSGLFAVSSGIDAGWMPLDVTAECRPTVPGDAGSAECGTRTRSGRRA